MKRVGTTTPVPIDLLRDPMLQRWIQPRYLDAERLATIQDEIQCKSHVHYVVLDDFFCEDRFDAVVQAHANLEFRSDVQGGVYDSRGYLLDDQPHPGAELLSHEHWHRYVAELLGVPLHEPGRTAVYFRSYREDFRGFWIHRDSSHVNPNVATVMCYFNRDWQRSDGGLLQFWKVNPDLTPGTALYTMTEYDGQRLDFLDQEQVYIMMQLPQGSMPLNLVKVDEIIPKYNRVVLCNSVAGMPYHSITPSNGRERNGFIQWLY